MQDSWKGRFEEAFVDTTEWGDYEQVTGTTSKIIDFIASEIAKALEAFIPTYEGSQWVRMYKSKLSPTTSNGKEK